MYNISVFISHSWSYSGHYDKLAEWIFGEKWNSSGVSIHFENTSVPKEDPIHNAPTASALRSAIYDRILLSNVVVIPTGMYSSHSDWIKEEIAGANWHKRPILAVNPWGQERKSMIVAKAATVSPVGWQKQSVIDGVWNLRNGY